MGLRDLLASGKVPPAQTRAGPLSPAGAAVDVDDVEVRYPCDPGDPEARALDGVSLSVGEGELVAVCGPSGSGKSTLLHVMGTLTSPARGHVYVAGHVLDGWTPRRLAVLRASTVGFVFQSINLLGHLTVAQNVSLPANLAGRPPRTTALRVAELLDLVGLGSKADRPAGALSGGEQQRVAMARALVNDPRLVLADEPTGNLDSRTGADVVDLLWASHRAGRTVVIVTHDMRLASQAGRIVHLRDGRITHETRPPASAAASPPLGQLLRLGQA